MHIKIILTLVSSFLFLISNIQLANAESTTHINLKIPRGCSSWKISKINNCSLVKSSWSSAYFKCTKRGTIFVDGNYCGICKISTTAPTKIQQAATLGELPHYAHAISKKDKFGHLCSLQSKKGKNTFTFAFKRPPIGPPRNFVQPVQPTHNLLIR